MRNCGPDYRSSSCSAVLVHHSRRTCSVRVILGLLVARQHIAARTFPWRQEVEGTKLLGELNRLIDDTFLLIVIANFDIAGHRKILAHGVAVKAVVGQDPP